MGIGPWAQGELIRDIERTERARFRKFVKRELRAVEESDARSLDGGEQALHRLLDKITPSKPKKIEKRQGR